jgi:hypothetical protein
MKKITPSSIKAAIVEEALKIKRKKELYESVLSINTELKQLNEVGWVGTFGFNNPHDISNKSKTGFANDFQNISHIAQLERDMQIKDDANTLKEEELNEVNKLKEEIASLKKQNEELKSQK